MNFINTFLLWSAAGAALPVLIHLLNREKPRKINIPTVEFIIKAVQKSSGSRKLNNFLLLFLRMMILLCISLIIARPQIEEYLISDNQESVQAVIIVDNSFYTVHKNADSSVIDEIKKEAKKVVESLPSGSMLSLISVEDRENEFTNIKEYIHEKIDLLSPAPTNASIHSQILTAQEMLSDFETKGKSKIYLISDMNKGSWNSNYQLSEKLANMTTLIPVKPRVGNIYIEDVQVKSTGFSKSNRIFQRRETEINVKINGDRNLSGTQVKLIIDNEVVDQKVILSETLKTELIFNTSFDKTGTYFCEVKIESKDSIPVDDLYYFNIQVQAPLKIYLANDTKSLSPLIYRAALSPSGWHGRQKFNVELLSYSRLQEKLPSGKPDLVLVCGSISMNPAEWRTLNNYLNEGGKVIISPDQSTLFTELNKNIFPLLKSKVKPVQKDVSLSLSANDSWKESLTIPSLYEVKIKNFYTYENESLLKKPDIPLRFDDGSPCLAIHQVNNGKLAFWGLSPDLDSSDFLNNDSFALLWHTLVEKMTEAEHLKKNLFCGTPVEVFADTEELKAYRVQSPAGTEDKLEQNSFQIIGQGLYKAEYDQTFIPGHYYCSSKNFKGFSCNLQRQEAFFQFPSKNEYASLLRDKEVDESQNIMSSAFSPDGLLAALVVFTLLFMILEIHLGNRNYYAGD